MLHPRTTHWFETYVPRDQTVYVLEALAATGQVELEKEAVDAPVIDTRELRDTVAAGQRLAARYTGLLPSAAERRIVVAADPEATARQALATLRGWLAAQLRRQRRLEQALRRQRRLELLHECLLAMGDAGESLAGFSRDSQFLHKRVYACGPEHATGRAADESGLIESFSGERHLFRVLASLPGHAIDDALERALQDCEPVEIPQWLIAAWSERFVRLEAARSAAADRVAQARQEIDAQRDAADVREALNTLAVLAWYLQRSITLTADRRACHITGWTTLADPQELHQALARAHVDASIVFRPVLPGHTAPVAAGAGRWYAPFRLFVDMFGTPGAREVDPTPLLAVLVPMLFGLMFPDLGHGLVLLVAGLALRSRVPQAGLLVPCGLAAVAAGILFGEFFGRHDVLPAAWICPLDEPLLVLLAPLWIGAGIVLLGLALSGVEAHWQGRLRGWLWLDAAVLLAYASLLAAVWQPWFLVVTAVALLHYLVGLGRTCRHPRGPCVTAGLGRLLYSALELAVNTLSFVRVGAFALAHTALTHMLVDLSAAIEEPALRLPVLVAGHALIIVVEGMVVFVQTTRLILFEFFTRFLRADGRLFRPLPAPGGP